MRTSKQKVLFQGPLAEALYYALRQQSEAQSVQSVPQATQESNEGLAVSLVNEQAGKRVVVHAQTISKLVVFGARDDQVQANDVCEFIELVTSAKVNTKVYLLLQGDDGEFTALLKEVAQTAQVPLYASFDLLMQELQA